MLPGPEDIRDILRVIRSAEEGHSGQYRLDYIKRCVRGSWDEHLGEEDCLLVLALRTPIDQLLRRIHIDVEPDFDTFDPFDSPFQDAMEEANHTEDVVRAVTLWRIEHKR